MMKMEVRNNSVVIAGYVNVPERKSRVMQSIRGKFTESIAGGVFKRAIETCTEKGQLNFGYLKGIINNWLKINITSCILTITIK